jgi:hypothetical protein
MTVAHVHFYSLDCPLRRFDATGFFEGRTSEPIDDWMVMIVGAPPIRFEGPS